MLLWSQWMSLNLLPMPASCLLACIWVCYSRLKETCKSYVHSSFQVCLWHTTSTLYYDEMKGFQHESTPLILSAFEINTRTCVNIQWPHLSVNNKHIGIYRVNHCDRSTCTILAADKETAAIEELCHLHISAFLVLHCSLQCSYPSEPYDWQLSPRIEKWNMHLWWTKTYCSIKSEEGGKRAHDHCWLRLANCLWQGELITNVKHNILGPEGLP